MVARYFYVDNGSCLHAVITSHVNESSQGLKRLRPIFETLSQQQILNLVMYMAIGTPNETNILKGCVE